MADQEELLDYAEEEAPTLDQAPEGQAQRGYVGIHSASFKDFQLREELQNAIKTHGFEHPSEGKYVLHRFGTRDLAWRTPVIPITESRSLGVCALLFPSLWGR